MRTSLLLNGMMERIQAAEEYIERSSIGEQIILIKGDALEVEESS